MLNHELRPLLISDMSVSIFLRKEYGVDFALAELLKDNFNFVFATTSLILRFSPASKKQRREIDAELSWTRFLNKRQLSINKIIPAASGTLCSHHTVAGQLLYLVVFQRNNGQPPEKEDWDAAHYARLGNLAGQLHYSSTLFQSQIDESFPHWHEHSKAAVLDKLPQDGRDLPRILQALMQRFIQLPTGPDTYGVIHYDIHQGNYFLQQDNPRAPLFLFDFEMTCQGWYLQDVAVILYYASNLNTMQGVQPRESFEKAFLTAFGNAYRQHMPDMHLDEALIQAHLLYRDLFVYAYVRDAWRGRKLTAGDQRLIDLLESNIVTRSVAQGFR